MAQMVKNLPAMEETWVWVGDQESRVVAVGVQDLEGRMLWALGVSLKKEKVPVRIQV